MPAKTLSPTSSPCVLRCCAVRQIVPLTRKRDATQRTACQLPGVGLPVPGRKMIARSGRVLTVSSTDPAEPSLAPQHDSRFSQKTRKAPDFREAERGGESDESENSEEEWARAVSAGSAASAGASCRHEGILEGAQGVVWQR